MGLVASLSLPVFASAHDSTIPHTFIGYSYSSGLNTDVRAKEDKTWNYVNNTSGFNLWVETHATDGSNQTKGGHAIVPTGQYFITNYVKETHHDYCYLNITTANQGTSGWLSGAWSPDSVGSYPVVN